MLGWRGWMMVAGFVTATWLESADGQFPQPAGSGAGIPPAKPVTAPDVPLPAVPLTKEQVEKPPVRPLKIAKDAQPLKLKFDQPDPKLAEQKFVVILRLKMSGAFHGGREPEFEKLSNVGGWPFLMHHHPLGRDGNVVFDSSNNDRDSLAEWLHRILQYVPPEKIVQSEQDFFGSWQPNVGFVRVADHWERVDGKPIEPWVPGTPIARVDPAKPDPPMNCIREFQILGTTEAECERRGRALMTMLDEGFCKPLQSAIWSSRAANADDFAASQKKYFQTRDSIPSLQKRLATFSDDSESMLPGLRVHLRTVEAELAANKARLAAYDKLLAPPAGTEKLSLERKKLIEDAKVLAEIDRSALEVRHQKAAEFVDNVKTRIELTKQLDRATGDVSSLQSHLASRREIALSLDRDLLAYSPIPLLDNKLIVRPIEWTTDQP